MGLTLAMTLIFEFSRSYVILTIWWPRSGVMIYQIVTGVTSGAVDSSSLNCYLNINLNFGLMFWYASCWILLSCMNAVLILLVTFSWPCLHGNTCNSWMGHIWQMTMMSTIKMQPCAFFVIQLLYIYVHFLHAISMGYWSIGMIVVDTRRLIQYKDVTLPV